ncbi:MAG: hypothetical protein RJA22_3065 [Verrucomicrobiota bacterium]|jgi:uncharacterized Ntn-hydrolase superfamily protein
MKRLCTRPVRLAALLLLLTAAPGPGQPTADPSLVATFSIVGYDPATGDLGVAVQSKFFGVGSVVPWARAGVGAIATQSYANVAYGHDGLRLLESGRSADETLRQLTEADARRATRQAGVVDARGRAAAFTGTNCHAWAGHRLGSNFCAQGNLLAGPGVVDAMADAFQAARQSGTGQLADWLMAALAAGQQAGGDKRGQQSAALLVVRDRAGFGGANDRFIDLRVEDHAKPIDELARLLILHKQFHAGAHRQRPSRAGQ